MPDSSIELHDWGLEGIFIGDTDIDIVCASFIRGTWRSLKGTLEVGNVGSVAYGAGRNMGQFVGVNIGHLFGYAACTTRRHDADLGR